MIRYYMSKIFPKCKISTSSRYYHIFLLKTWDRVVKWLILDIIAPLSDSLMFYVKYLTMHMHAGTIRQLLYGCVYVREIIHSLKLVDYLPVQTHKPYNSSFNPFFIIIQRTRERC